MKIENVKFEPAPADKFPRCPHCKKQLETIWFKSEDRGFEGQHEICMCPHCEAFLSYSVWEL